MVTARACKAAEELAADEGISVEVIDLRTLVPLDAERGAPTRWRRTGRLVVAQEADQARRGGERRRGDGRRAARIASLRAPIVRVAGRNTVIPFNLALERASVPQVDDVVAGVRAVVGDRPSARAREETDHDPAAPRRQGRDRHRGVPRHRPRDRGAVRGARGRGSSSTTRRRRGGRGRGRRRSTRAGGDAFAVEADVSERVDVRRLVDATMDRYGRIDILVNNAGVMIARESCETTEDGLGPDDRRQPEGRLPVLQGGRADHDPPGGRHDHQHVLELGALPPVGDALHRVRRLEGRHERPDQGDGPGARPARSRSTRSAPAGSGPTWSTTSTPRSSSASSTRPPCSGGGRPTTSPSSAVFLASDEAAFITGELLIVAGGRGMH